MTTQPLSDPHLDTLPELTLRGIILGALITMVFTSSNVYLGLKVGLTFSSSIPAVVISFAVLSFFARSNILENNMVQTQASAAGTLSAVIFILPAILMLGYWQSFEFVETLLVCFAGGTLGVLFSIPLRRALVVNSDLPYPEGVAAAEILRAGHRAGNEGGGAGDILFGGLLAAGISFCSTGLQLLADKTGIWFTQGRAIFQIPVGFSLALVSAGYLMGLTAGLAMFIGLALCWGLFVPYFSAQLPAMPGDIMAAANEIWNTKVRFIGTGVLTVASLWTLVTLFKPVLEGFKLSLQSLRQSGEGQGARRTDRDLSPRAMLLCGALALCVLAFAFHSFVRDAPLPPSVGWGLVAFSVLLILLLGFFIAAACGYMAGLVGSSNSPISGIGVVGVIIVSAVLVFMDSGLQVFTSPEGKRFGMALTIFVCTAVVSVAAISNDNLQDLKTGYLVGATPRNQQIALIIGCGAGALVIAPVLGILYEAYGFAGAPPARPGMDPELALAAPQATLMKTVVQGIFSHNLDWDMIIAGFVVGALVIGLDTLLGRMKSRMRISALAVGLGIYLSPSVSAAIIVGSLLNHAVKRHRARQGGARSAAEEETQRGVLIASGFIVGESLMGVVLALAVLLSLGLGYGETPFSLAGPARALLGDSFEAARTLLSALVFAAACAMLYKKAT